MRVVGKKEREKMGCIYCCDYKKRKGVRMCKHEECPYHELDGYETYEDFFHSQAGLLEGPFETEVT